MPLHELRGIFPNLRCDQHTITSDTNINYNCVSWVIQDKLKWWEPYGTILPTSSPPYHWPKNIPQDKRPETYVAFFEGHGFEVTGNSEFEAGVPKIAIYVLAGEFAHVARQKQNGKWTSKLGPREDIQHDLREIEGDREYSYGKAEIFMKRKVQAGIQKIGSRIKAKIMGR